MSTTVNSRYIIDLPEWRALSQPIAGNFTNNLFTASQGQCMSNDLRCRDYQHPLVYTNISNTLCSYNIKNDAWFGNRGSIGLGGTSGTGSTSVYCPTFSPMGTISAGATVNKVTLTTALPASVITNQLANRGDGLGFIVRIIGNAGGSSGLIEERRVIANTSGTTPTIWFDKPLSFTPATGDRYEFLSGSVLFLNTGASSTANILRRYDVLTDLFSSLSTTGMIATIPNTYNRLIALDEQYVPYDRNPGEGQVVGAATYDTSGDFTKKCLTATNSAAGTLTGQALAGDANIVANQYRNYQIRIVEDTAIPTAVGQRRRISSHTAGASPVYTLSSNWTVTPSTNCKFVIENDTDRIIAFHGGTTLTYNYFISNLGNTGATANTWNSGDWAVRSVAMSSGGLTTHGFGIKSDGENTIKSSNIVSWRGASTTYDVFDISGAATGAWTNGLTISIWSSNNDSISGSSEEPYFAYNPHTQNGRYFYSALGAGNATNAIQRSYYRFDCISGILIKIAGPKLGTGSTSLSSFNCSFCSVFQDGDTKVAFYNTTRIMSGTDYYQLMLTF
jgi:hypothetical protein